MKRRAKQYVQKLVGAKTELKQKTTPKKLMRSVERRSVEIAKEKCRDWKFEIYLKTGIHVSVFNLRYNAATWSQNWSYWIYGFRH